MERRTYLQAAVGSISTMTLAGCLGSDDEGEYPSDEITVVVPFGAGGGTDSAFRTVQEGLENALPDSSGLVIDNRSGAAGRLGTEDVYNAKPDGYTILSTPTEPVIGQFFFDVGYDIYEMKPISYVLDNLYSLVASPNRFGDDFETFIEDAREEDEISIGSVGVGGSNNYAGVAALDALDIDFSHVPYDSGSEVANAAASGDVDIGVAAHTGTIGMIKEDELQMHLLLHSEQFYDDVPIPDTVDYDIPIVTFAMGVYGPPDMPEERAQELESIIQSALESDETQQAAENAGLVLQDGSSEALEQIITDIESEIDEYRRILDEQDIEY